MLEQRGLDRFDRNLIERNLLAGCEGALTWLWILRPMVDEKLTDEGREKLAGMIEELAFDVNCGTGNLKTDGKENAEQIYRRVIHDAKEKQRARESAKEVGAA